jgi:hypothetical protein
MKFIITTILLVLSIPAISQISFPDYFVDKTLRIDLTHAGNSISEYFFVSQIKQEPFWGGNKKQLVDISNLGDYKFEMIDSASSKIIFSKGFSNLFIEWKTTEEAKTISRSFYECLTMPYPRKSVIVKIYGRNEMLHFVELYHLSVNPADYQIMKEKPILCRYTKIHDSGKPENKVDVVFIPDGYSQSEMNKWEKDASRMMSYLFNSSPFKENKDRFNIWKLDALSEESGTDSPGTNIWKNTVVHSNFYTFGSDRYLMSYDLKKIHDLAANVPYDQIYILVNTNEYGGGGIYNFYSCTSVDNDYSEFVFIHEFGHGFAGLGDEYYTSDTPYSDILNNGEEPWQPNVSSLKNFETKWKNMVDKDTPIPTPLEPKYLGKVGAFEGAAYQSKGLYRPFNECTMKSIIVDGFCPVCRKSIQQAINYQCE